MLKLKQNIKILIILVWISLRARIIVYATERVDKNKLLGYKSLSKPNF